MPTIVQPPYSPELNPAERVFEEVRRWVEGRIYRSIDDKMEAVNAYLRELEWFGLAGRRRTREPSLSHSLALLSCLLGTFSLSCQILSNLLWFTPQPRRLSRAVILR